MGMDTREAASLADRVRRRDPDRYFCALFAPGDRREALFTLYATNDELARAQEVATEPGLALIRLQWWREVVEGAARRHEVAQPLRALLDGGVVAPGLMLDMIAAREADIEGPPATLKAFLARMRQGPGGLAAAAGMALGADADELVRLRDIGAAYGVAGTWRNVAALGARQRCVLPLDVLAAAGLVPEAAFSEPDRVRAAVRPALAAAAASLLIRRRRMRRAVAPAALPGVLARRDMAGHGVPGLRELGDKASVVFAAITGII